MIPWWLQISNQLNLRSTSQFRDATVQIASVHGSVLVSSQQPSAGNVEFHLGSTTNKDTSCPSRGSMHGLFQSSKVYCNIPGNCCQRLELCKCLRRGLKWCFDLFRWLWEWFSNTILKHHRLVFIRNTLVHHWAIPVTLHMSLETLMWSTPTNLTNL